MPKIQSRWGFQGRSDVQLMEQGPTYRAGFALDIALGVMKHPRLLDFSILKQPLEMPLWIRLPEDIGRVLEGDIIWSEFHDRVRAAQRFFVKGEIDARWNVEARLRAGLNEFYSLEDAANRACRAMGIAKAPQIVESKHPLVHAMYALRHVNVHVKPTGTRNQEVSLVISDLTDPYEFTKQAAMLAEDSAYDVLSTREVKAHYSAGDMKRSLNWILLAQRTFGIGIVFELGLEQYCREVLASAA